MLTVKKLEDEERVQTTLESAKCDEEKGADFTSSSVVKKGEPPARRKQPSQKKKMSRGICDTEKGSCTLY